MADSSTPKRRILIVDDEVSVTMLYRRAIEQNGEFMVKEENDALRAVEAARTFRPHLILLDHHLPGRSGPEIAADLAADPELKRIPIVFLTGDVDTAVARIGYPALLKPVRSADLVATCNAWALAAEG